MESELNHKRKKPKQSRAGCLLCKPNKLGKGLEKKLGHRGFGKLRREAAAAHDATENAVARETHRAAGEHAAHLRPRVPLFHSGKPRLAERANEELEHFGET